jgi:hypothetical protein
VLPEEPFFSASCKYPAIELGTVWNRCVPRVERIGFSLVRNRVLQATQFSRTLAEISRFRELMAERTLA